MHRILHIKVEYAQIHHFYSVAPQIHGGNYHHRDVNITGINFGPVGTPVTVLIGGVEALSNFFLSYKTKLKACDVIIDHTEIYCEVEKSVATASVSLSVTADGVGPATYSIFPPSKIFNLYKHLNSE